MADEDAALRAVLDPGFDPGAEAIVERPVAAGSGGGTATIAAYEPERVEIEANAPGGGLVVLSDVFMPGWHATVDGRETPIERVDYLLRGVPVGPGRHVVELSYRPAGWTAGLIVSALAAAALLAALALGRRR